MKCFDPPEEPAPVNRSKLERANAAISGAAYFSDSRPDFELDSGNDTVDIHAVR